MGEETMREREASWSSNQSAGFGGHFGGERMNGPNIHKSQWARTG